MVCFTLKYAILQFKVLYTLLYRKSSCSVMDKAQHYQLRGRRFDLPVLHIFGCDFKPGSCFPCLRMTYVFCGMVNTCSLKYISLFTRSLFQGQKLELVDHYL